MRAVGTATLGRRRLVLNCSIQPIHCSRDAPKQPGRKGNVPPPGKNDPRPTAPKHGPRTRSRPRAPTPLKSSSTGCPLRYSMATSQSAPRSLTVSTTVDSEQASTLAVQNMVLLCKLLKLSVTYKVLEEEAGGREGDGSQRHFLVVVHVHGDHCFKRYTDHSTLSDLPLYRGLLIQVQTSRDLSQCQASSVRQAFLPKFENEGQDESIAQAIVDQADTHYLVVTVKHSGSLTTLSSRGFAAKNSLDNEYTAGAMLLLRTHFQRMHGPQHYLERLQRFMGVLKERRMAVSFEMVTGCHGHHGQVPAGEYLVATAAHAPDPGTGLPRFLAWGEFMDFCLDQGLPVNDTWLFASRPHAEAARNCLDTLSLSGGHTAIALAQLQALMEAGAESGCVHLSGTYPHEEWQGSRLEGFVVAQGQAITHDAHQALQQLARRTAASVLHRDALPTALRTPYKDLIHRLTPSQEDQAAAARAATELAVPASQHDNTEKESVRKNAIHAIASSLAQALFPADKDNAVQVATKSLKSSLPPDMFEKDRPRRLHAVAQAAATVVSECIVRAVVRDITKTELHWLPEFQKRATTDADTRQKVLQAIVNAPAPGLLLSVSGPPAADPTTTPLMVARSRLRELQGSDLQELLSAAIKSRTAGVTATCESGEAGASREQHQSRTVHGDTSEGSAARQDRPVEKGQAVANSSLLVPDGVAATALLKRLEKALQAQQEQEQEERKKEQQGKQQQKAQQQEQQQQQEDQESAAMLEPEVVPDALRTFKADLPLALLGAPAPHNRLRYKKKMLLYAMPTPDSSEGPSAGAGQASGPPTARTAEEPGAGQGVAGRSAGQPGWVGYCMMTFMLRNGLNALAVGREEYLNQHVRTLARRWGLAKSHAAKVEEFAEAWASWVSAHGGAAAVSQDKYLHVAEPFVEQFLAGYRAQPASDSGPKFQGIVVLVDVAEEVVQALQRRLDCSYLDRVHAGNKLPQYRDSLITQGTLLHLPPGLPPHNSLKKLVEDAGGARHVWLVVQRPPTSSPGSNTPAAKRIKGLLAGASSAEVEAHTLELPAPEDLVLPAAAAPPAAAASAGPITAATAAVKGDGSSPVSSAGSKSLGRVGIAEEEVRVAGSGQQAAGGVLEAGAEQQWQVQGPRHTVKRKQNAEPTTGQSQGQEGRVGAPDASPGPAEQLSPAVVQQLVELVAARVGLGAPLPAPDPAVVACFVSIPGIGKTVMVGGLQPLLAQPLPAASPTASPVSQQAHTPQKEVGPAAQPAGARSPPMPVAQTPRPAGRVHPHTPPRAPAQPPGPKPAPSQGQPRQQPAALGRQGSPSAPQGTGPRVAVAAGGPGSSRAAGARPPEPLVVLCNSDTMKAAGRAKTYWDDVAAAASTRRGPGSATVVVADKNLCPSPAGNLAKVSGILRASGAVSLALVPVVCGPSSRQLQPELYHGLPDTPFPLELVALCLARVVGRTQHEGKLDAGLPTACSVVAMFANFFKNHSSQRLGERLRDCLDLVQELPVMTFPPQHQDALLPLMRHIADGLSRVDERGKKPLPEEWENQARKLLAQDAVKAALAGCQLPLDRVQADCCGAMRAALDVARDRAAGASGPGARIGKGVKGVADERVRYIAVAGISRQPLVTAVSAMLGEDVANKVKAELHITLWHSSDAAKHDLRSALMAELGTEVAFEITAIDHQEGAVTAAVVKILSAPEAVLEKEYPHVTLVVGANAAAKDANLLPQRVAEGRARRIPLAEPVLLSGPILAISKG